GAWIAAVAGLGGMRDHGGELSFRPRLPQALARLAFRVTYRGRCLRVEIRHGEVSYEVLRGEPFEIEHDGERVLLDPKATRPWTLPDVGEEPSQPPGRAPRRRRGR
ncbi:MAG TPA: glycosyl hydrolase family 65 protein, partial [Solirubrobacter sp.]|nr:glycosyl hydrolase family 65 protein [Solirubrobacter sp.]